MKAPKVGEEWQGMSFEQWIRAVGVQRIAKMLELTPKAVKRWLDHNDPRVDVMRKIKVMTGGAIDYDKMIDRRVRSSRVRPSTIKKTF